MVKAEAKKKLPKKPVAPYVFAVGRRKSAVARLKLEREGTGEFVVNGREAGQYFPTIQHLSTIARPLAVMGLEKKVNVRAAVTGGGVAAQASAVSLAMSRALVKSDPATKAVLKKQGLLTRDAREKERKKPGLKRARRAPQWQKR